MSEPEQNPVIDTYTGERLTPSWVAEKVAGRQLIALIKAIRGLTGEGLKECKDRVDAILALPLDHQVPKALELFAPWLDLKGYKEKIAKLERERVKAERKAERERQQELAKAERIQQQQHEQRRKELDNEGTKTIMAAMECICKNWRTLGFNDKLTGCHSILRNFKYKLPI